MNLSFDIIILDIGLPDRGGLSLLHEMRGLGGCIAIGEAYSGGAISRCNSSETLSRTNVVAGKVSVSLVFKMERTATPR